MSSANAQLNAILAQSAVAVGAMQAQQVSHQLQSMQVREAMLQRYLQALELQRTSINQELDEARGRATEGEMRRQFKALIDAGRRRRECKAANQRPPALPAPSTWPTTA